LILCHLFKRRDAGERGDLREMEGNASQMITIAALCAFAVYLVLGIMHHSAWRDEWQAINIARAATSIPDLYARLRYEAHPALWYLAIQTVWKISPSLVSVQVLNSACALVAAGLIAFLAPWPLWLRLLVAFSGPAAWEFSVKARSYGLGWLIIVGLALVVLRMESRYKAWIIVLLAILALNTSLFTGLIGFSLFAGWLWEEHLAKRLGAAILPTAVLGMANLATLFFMIPAHDVAAPDKVPFSQLADLLEIFAHSVIPGASFAQAPLLAAVIVVCVATVSFRLLCVTSGGRVALACGWLSTMAVFVFVVRGFSWHHWHLFLAVIAVAIAFERRAVMPRSALAILATLAALGLHYGVSEYIRDWRKPYSGAKAMTQAIKANRELANAQILVTPDYFSAPVSGYLDRSVENASCRGASTYMVWRKEEPAKWLPCAIQLASRNPQHLILVTLNEPLRPEVLAGLEATYTVKMSLIGSYLADDSIDPEFSTEENFHLYQMDYLSP
jgi:hypothetical protein